MDESLEGLIDRDRFISEMYEQESWASSGSYKDLLICPSLRSYSSLEELSTCSDKEGCRLVNLNNVIKKLYDTIDDPIRKQEVAYVCCLLAKFIKYNGGEGFYAKHLPYIGEILEFLSMESKKVPQYIDFLHRLLELCCKPLLLQHSSELLDINFKLQRYFSLLGYLLILAPTKRSFFTVKFAIEILVCCEDKTNRNDAVKPDARREAVEQSRLPLTLAELAEVASVETYPAVLELAFAVADVSTTCCHRMLEAGIETRILTRLMPTHECGCECKVLEDDENLLCDREDYFGSADRAVKILGCLTMSLFAGDDVAEECGCLGEVSPPTKEAMWSLRAALRRELLRAGRSSRSRKLRNELANLILAGIVRCPAKWQLTGTGIIEDLADFFVATEYEIVGGWARGTKLEVDNCTGLEFEKTLLAILAKIGEMVPECVCPLKRKNIVSGLLLLIEQPTTDSKSTKPPWNSEQLWHLFKYASNALTHLAPKMPDEFVENNGASRLLARLDAMTTGDYDDALVTRFAEMMCSLSLANCDMIARNIRERRAIPVLFGMIRRVLSFEALALKHQKVIAYLLVAAESILINEEYCEDCFCESNVKMTIELLHRCLHQKVEDSQLDEGFLVAIGSFACKCAIHCLGSQRTFLTTGGLFLTLDITESTCLPVQNLFLGLLVDICENALCRRYLFSWKWRGDKRKGILSLLANIWRREERMFGVERTQIGGISNTEMPVLNDEEWMYVSYFKSLSKLELMTTTAVRSVRPKIHYLHKLIVKYAGSHRKYCYGKLFNELPVEDQITILAVDAYPDLKSSEASLATLTQLKVPPLTKSRNPLHPPTSKLDLWSSQSRAVRERQESLQLERSSQEDDTLERMKHANLSSAFDELKELGRGARGCRLEKMRQEMKRENVCGGGPWFETCDFDEDAFEKDVIIQSIPEDPSSDSTSVEEASTPPSPTLSLQSLSRYSTTTDGSENSESSVALRATKKKTNNLQRANKDYRGELRK